MKKQRLPAILAFVIVAVAVGIFRMPRTGHAVGGAPGDDGNGCGGGADQPSTVASSSASIAGSVGGAGGDVVPAIPASRGDTKLAGLPVPSIPVMSDECKALKKTCAIRCKNADRAHKKACQLGCFDNLVTEKKLMCPRLSDTPKFANCDQVDRYCGQRCRLLDPMVQPQCFEQCPVETGKEIGLTCEPIEPQPIHQRPATDCAEVKAHCELRCSKRPTADAKAACLTYCDASYAEHSGLKC